MLRREPCFALCVQGFDSLRLQVNVKVSRYFFACFRFDNRKNVVMTERVITVSDRFLKNLFYSLLFSLLILFVIHLLSDYAGTFNGRGGLYNYIMSCPFGTNHVFTGQGVSTSEIANGGISATKLLSAIQAAINHWIILLLVTAGILLARQSRIRIKFQDSNADINTSETKQDEPRLEVRPFTRTEKLFMAGAGIVMIVVVYLLVTSG
jgi:hypothetical protein